METLKKLVNSKKLIFSFFVVIGVIMFFVANFVIGTGIEFMEFLGGMIDGNEDNDFKLNFNNFWMFQSRFIMFYLIFYVLVFAIVGRIFFNFKLNFEDLDKGQHGTRSFETVENMKKQYKLIPSKDEEYEGAGGVIVAGLNEEGSLPFKNKPYKLMIDESPVHTMVIGITRSGKGETFVVPMLDVLSRAKEKPSLVVNDPKGELAGASYETLKDRGYDVHIYNLMKQDMGMGFNPLQIVIDAWKEGDRDRAIQYTTSIGHSLYHNPNSKEPMWEQSAASLVNAIILAIVEDSIDKGEEHKVNMYSVGIFLSTLGSDTNEQTGENALDQFFQARDDGNPAKEMYATANFSGGNMRGSIFSLAMNKLQIFTSEPNARLTSYNSMDLTDIGFGDRPVAIFMVTPDYDTSNHVLASIFVSQLYRVNAEKATMGSGKMNRHVHFMLDEFGNMPTIEGMEGMVTVGAGRGFRFHLIIQSYSQVDSQYGDDGAKTIIGNCSNQIYILTQDKSTAEQYSGLLGTKTITDVSRSGSLFSTTKSHSESTKERALLLPDELMELNQGESVVIRVNKREDLKRNKIKPKPIFNSLESSTYHKFRWQYLADDFDTDISVLGLPISSAEYHDIDLKNIVFTASPKYSDAYIELRKLLTSKQLNSLKRSLSMFSQTSVTYEFINEWSSVHLLSHIVYDLRPELEYFTEYAGVRHLNLLLFCSEDFIDDWEERLKFALDNKGANIFKPEPPKRPKRNRNLGGF